MESLLFYIVDVFAETKYTGNQLAVILNAGTLTSRQMQAIAKEINYSETTFILSNQPHSSGYPVRIFTPETELPFAGHPTLGTAYIIQQKIIQKRATEIILNLPIGQIPVNFDYDQPRFPLLWMEQQPPKFKQIISADSITKVLNLDIDSIDTRFPIQEVSTGIPFIIIPLKNQAALKSIQVNRDKYFELITTTEAKCILAFCPQTQHPENQLQVRVFCDYLGIPEDPATGSANGCLAAYLLHNSYFGSDTVDISVEQGYEIGRPSRLHLKAFYREKIIQVRVGGKVIPVAQGELL